MRLCLNERSYCRPCYATCCIGCRKSFAILCRVAQWFVSSLINKLADLAEKRCCFLAVLTHSHLKFSNSHGCSCRSSSRGSGSVARREGLCKLRWILTLSLIAARRRMNTVGGDQWITSVQRCLIWDGWAVTLAIQPSSCSLYQSQRLIHEGQCTKFPFSNVTICICLHVYAKVFFLISMKFRGVCFLTWNSRLVDCVEQR